MDSTSPTPEPASRRGWTPAWRWAVVALVTAVALLVTTAASTSSPPLPHGTLPRTASGAPGASTAPAESAASTELRARATSSTTTSTTTPPPPVVTPPPEDTTLHTPEDVPDPSVRRPIQILGRIQIPTIGLDTEVRDQITQESIDLGPSHWPGTAAPGGFGNVVIGGHRSSHSAPFHDLGALHNGDAIVLVDASGRAFTYTVTEMFVVNPDAMWITEQRPGHTLTIFTCHPIGSSAQRLVVRATLAS